MYTFLWKFLLIILVELDPYIKKQKGIKRVMLPSIYAYTLFDYLTVKKKKNQQKNIKIFMAHHRP